MLPVSHQLPSENNERTKRYKRNKIQILDRQNNIQSSINQDILQHLYILTQINKKNTQINALEKTKKDKEHSEAVDLKDYEVLPNSNK